MFRHVSLFRWRPGTSAEQVQAFHDALSLLPAAIPEIRAYKPGADAGLVQGNWDFVVVADFDDPDGWRTYVHHPAHQQVIDEHVRGLLGDRAAAQYEL